MSENTALRQKQLPEIIRKHWLSFLKNSSQNFRCYSFASKIYSGIQSKKARQNNEQSNAKGARYVAFGAMKK